MDSLQDPRSAGVLQGGIMAFSIHLRGHSLCQLCHHPSPKFCLPSCRTPSMHYQGPSPRLGGHPPPPHCLVLSFSNNSALSNGHIPPLPSIYLPSKPNIISLLSKGLSHNCWSLIQWGNTPPFPPPYGTPKESCYHQDLKQGLFPKRC